MFQHSQHSQHSQLIRSYKDRVFTPFKRHLLNQIGRLKPFLLCSFIAILCALSATSAQAQRRASYAESLVSENANLTSHDHFHSGNDGFHPLVNGGLPVTEDEPVALSTVMIKTDIQYCTATIIGPNVLLSAAHCIDDRPQGVEIYFQGLKNENPLYYRPATRYVLHDKYQDIKDSDARHDLALVFFEGDLPPNFKVAPLLGDEQQLGIGDTVTIAGYGRGSPLGRLAKIDLPITRFSKEKTLIWLGQSKAQGACHGDSGGPAYKIVKNNIYLAAVTSYGETVDCDRHAIYTSLKPYRDWLRQQSGLALP